MARRGGPHHRRPVRPLIHCGCAPRCWPDGQHVHDGRAPRRRGGRPDQLRVGGGRALRRCGGWPDQLRVGSGRTRRRCRRLVVLLVEDYFIQVPMPIHHRRYPCHLVIILAFYAPPTISEEFTSLLLMKITQDCLLFGDWISMKEQVQAGFIGDMCFSHYINHKNRLH